MQACSFVRSTGVEPVRGQADMFTTRGAPCPADTDVSPWRVWSLILYRITRSTNATSAGFPAVASMPSGNSLRYQVVDQLISPPAGISV